MKPRIKVITLGVSDLEKSLVFYRDGMGWQTEGIIGTEFEDGAVVFFEMNDDSPFLLGRCSMRRALTLLSVLAAILCQELVLADQPREITGKDAAPMVLVPVGEFLYGDDNKRLSLTAFYMDKYEVTTSRYAKFLQETGRKQPRYWDQVSQVNVGNRPVIGVDWYDADVYCRQYGRRLPTEQEWEKAARGTDGRKYPWGNEEPTSRHANFSKQWTEGNYYSDRLQPVGSYEDGKSPYGIYDLAGNVWEWTSSDYDSSSKVLRGGSWLLNVVPPGVRSANRRSGDPWAQNTIHGFRCAQDGPQ